MELKLYLAVLWQRRLLIVASAGLGLLIGVFFTLLLPPRYRAEAILRVPTPLVGSRESAYYDSNYAGRLMSTYAQEASGPGMVTLLKEQFGVAPKITAKVIGNSELIEIAAVGPDPQVVALAANYVATYFVQQRAEQPRPLAALERTSLNTIISSAVVPTTPVSPRMGPNLLLGLIGGLIIGVALAFIRESLDRRLYTSEQIAETTGLTTLAHIPSARASRPNSYLNVTTPQSEAFRQLRTNLLTYSKKENLHSLLVTSAQSGEGKTTTVASLAVALGQSGRNVIAVDCDLRNPGLHAVFGLPNEFGVSDVLEGTVTLENAIVNHSTIRGLSVLTSGRTPEYPAELLGSARMQELLCQLADQFQFVLIDAPPLNIVDASILATHVDGVILVVRRAEARRDAVAFARGQLAAVKVQPVGVVVNQVKMSAGYPSYSRTA